MDGPNSVTTLIDRILPVLTPIATFLLGKAMKGGANQHALDAVCEDVKEIQRVQTQQTAALASHTTLHEGYVNSFQNITRNQEETNRLLGRVAGRLGIGDSNRC